MNYTRYHGKRPARRGRILLRVFAVLVILGLLAFGTLEGLVIAGSRTELRSEPEVMVILGAQLKDTGPSVLLADRLDTAIAYLEEHPELPVVVAGGQGEDEPTTEAVGMRDYLTARGIDPARIWLEDRSHNTKENLVNTAALLAEKGMDPAETHLLVVSNGFHLCRVRMLSARFGLDISTLAAPSSHVPAKIYSYLREVAALVKSFVFDR